MTMMSRIRVLQFKQFLSKYKQVFLESMQRVLTLIYPTHFEDFQYWKYESDSRRLK